jgi:hypothetical protein
MSLCQWGKTVVKDMYFGKSLYMYTVHYVLGAERAFYVVALTRRHVALSPFDMSKSLIFIYVIL